MLVLATQPPAHDMFALGESWRIHVPGECESGHWVAAQGEEILQMLRAATENIGDAQGALPRLFIISPFRDVADNLRRLAVSRSREWCPGDRATIGEIRKWAKRSIGTVHTFQGKEADAVILSKY